MRLYRYKNLSESENSHHIIIFPRHLRITVRTIIVMMILTCRGCYFVLEQPGSSQVVHFPELKLLKKLMKSCGLTTYFTRLPRTQMGRFILDKISALCFYDVAKSETLCSHSPQNLCQVGWAAGAQRAQSCQWPSAQRCGLSRTGQTPFFLSLNKKQFTLTIDPTLLDQWVSSLTRKKLGLGSGHFGVSSAPHTCNNLKMRPFLN